MEGDEAGGGLRLVVGHQDAGAALGAVVPGGAALAAPGRRRREAGREERELRFVPFLLGIGDVILGIEKKLRGKRDGKSICWKGFFQHQFFILRKGGKGIEKNQTVRAESPKIRTSASALQQWPPQLTQYIWTVSIDWMSLIS